MSGFFSTIKAKFSPSPNYDQIEAAGEPGDYIEVGRDKEQRSRVLVRPFVLENFEDVKPVLDSLREGTTIALVNIKPLKDADLIELKRAINKLKKTTDAIEGEIAGFGEDYLVITPSFASIYRTRQTTEVKGEPERSEAKE